MRVVVRALALLAALLVGGALALATRTPSPRRGARPAAVERVTKAVDAYVSGAPDALRDALAAAGGADAFPAPWREEILLGELVLRGERDALRGFATGSPPSPARARAGLRLALEGRDATSRAEAFRALAARYPGSAAARVFALPSRERTR